MQRKHELFHILWTKAVGTEGYNKQEWLELERFLYGGSAKEPAPLEVDSRWSKVGLPLDVESPPRVESSEPVSLAHELCKDYTLDTLPRNGITNPMFWRIYDDQIMPCIGWDDRELHLVRSDGTHIWVPKRDTMDLDWRLIVRNRLSGA